MRKRLFLITIMLLSVACVFAQVDSTYIPIVTPVVNAIEGKYAWVTGALAFLWLLSEALASIPSVRANSIFQLIAGWLGIIEKKP